MPRFRVLDPSSPAFSPIRDLPLTPDDLFSLENEPRRAPMPDDFVAEFSDRRVFVSDQEGGEPVSDFVRLDRSTGMLRVPPRSFLGRPGVEAEYREAPEVPGDIAASEPFRPDWSGYLYHPRSAAAATRPSLRRADGRRCGPQRLLARQSPLLRAVGLSDALHRAAECLRHSEE